MKYSGIKKAIVSLTLCFSMLLPLAPGAGAVKNNIGDIDGDNATTAADARIALRAAVGLIVLSGAQKERADLDYDNEITANDARLILRMAVGLNNNNFEQILYNVAHPQLGKTKKEFVTGVLAPILSNFQKWCCYYTIHDVFRPALEQAGYSAAEIEKIAPTRFSRDSLAKALKSVNTNIPSLLAIDSIDYYVPSLLNNYYIIYNDVYDSYYTLYSYYDDVVEKVVYPRVDEIASQYEPEIGDILFMSNKSRTYKNGYPTVDHTAQIIEMYDDGSFLCTEGSIIDYNEGDGIARVRERSYVYDEKLGTYVYGSNRNIIVLAAAKPYM